MLKAYEKYFRDNLPHIWCPGCGNGIVMGAFGRAVEKLGYENDDVMVVSGIGCSSRITGYLDFYTMHTAHGRALAVATGAKVAEPRLKTFVIMGDGDAAAIGGNHFIHACRRNIDMTAIVINNNIYGMTGGQFSPLTPKGAKATTAPYGSIDRSFDMVDLAIGAGATYVARGDIYHAAQLTDLIVEAANHKGFSVIEVVSSCPTSFGRRNKKPTAAQMMNYIKDVTMPKKAAEKLPAEKSAGKILTGKFFECEAEEYCEAQKRLYESLQEAAKK